MSDIPRTKEFCIKMENKEIGVSYSEFFSFCCQLERELTSMTTSRDQWRECATHFYDILRITYEKDLELNLYNFLEVKQFYEALKQEEEK